MFEALWRATRQSARTLIRERGFTATAVLVLALGVGTSTGILSLTRAVLTQALPYPHGDRLVQLFEGNEEHGMPEVSTSYPNFLDWRRQAESFEVMAVAYNPLNVVIDLGEETRTATASVVMPEYFEITGARPHLGRLFDADDNLRPGGHPVVVVSQQVWEQQLGADRNAVGSSIGINGRPYAVVGVMPTGFADYPNVTQQTDLWLPLMMGPELIHPLVLEQRINRALPVIGRLREGVSIADAKAEMVTISGRLEEAYPESSTGWVITMKSVREAYLGAYRAPLLALLVGSAFLLLVGCANIANLQLVRARDCHCDLTLRAALGASRRRLFAEKLVESLMLTAAGAVIGIVSAAWLTPLIATSMPVQLPAFVDLQLDRVALGIAVATSVGVGVIFGLVPLIGLGRGDLRSTLRGTGRGRDGAAGGQRLRRALVIVEVAAAAVLMLGAGLFVRSTTELLRTDVGFAPDNLVTLRMRIPLESRSTGEMVTLAGELERATAGLPGVSEAALWAPHVPGVALWYTAVRQADRPDLRDEELTLVRFHYVGSGALGTLGLELVAGRGFEPIDGPDGEQVVVVSESLAAALWPGEDPLGKVMRRWNRDIWRRVVGVVGDARLGGRQGPGGDFARDVYFPYAQGPQNDIALVVRTDGAASAGMLAEVVQEHAADLPVYNVQTMRDVLAAEEATPKITAALATGTAFLALLLAGIGLYSVVAFGVARQRHEIGLRMALGAWPAVVLRNVVAQGVRPALVGIALGVVVAMSLTRLLAALLYEVSATDPLTFVAVPVVVMAVVTLACLVPARRATRISPMTALRQD